MSPPGAGAAEPERRRRSGPRRRSTARADLARTPGFAAVSPEVGVLDREAFDAALARDPDATLTLLVEMTRATDERLRAQARELARRVVLDVDHRHRPRRPGVHRLRAVRAEQGGELDVDASVGAVVDARAAGRAPAPRDLVARDWARPDLALCLLIDSSGSMSGRRLAAAALAAGACTWRAPRDHAVLSFARTTTVLRDLHSQRPAAEVVDAILGLQAHGTTALATALRGAADQLGRSRAARRVAVLLSDCRSTDGEDPVPIAAAVPELVVIAPGGDSDEAEALARATGARWTGLDGPADIPAAFARVLDDQSA